jgi:CHAD domain-containing protein
MIKPIVEKFRIKKLHRKKKFKSAAPIVINDKLKKVMKEIIRYQEIDSVENLHKMRIAFRRLRYSMEIFSNCFDEILFTNLYQHTRLMQDILGKVRDLDVLEEKLKLLEKKEKLCIPETIFQNIIKEKTELCSAIKTELIKFVTDKDVNRFLIN